MSTKFNALIWPGHEKSKKGRGSYKSSHEKPRSSHEKPRSSRQNSIFDKSKSVHEKSRTGYTKSDQLYQNSILLYQNSILLNMSLVSHCEVSHCEAVVPLLIKAAFARQSPHTMQCKWDNDNRLRIAEMMRRKLGCCHRQARRNVMVRRIYATSARQFSHISNNI